MRPTILICLLALISGFVRISFGSYERPPAGKDVVLTQDDIGPTTPQQVHISLAGSDKMRISWITQKDAPSLVEFGTAPGVYNQSGNGKASRYRYGLFYKSGLIHEVVIGPLAPNTQYYYRCSGDSSKEYTLKTPPANLPIKFAVVGDLGQTVHASDTLQHIEALGYDVLLLPGDLSYADKSQPKWDTFGQLVEPVASRRPWMVATGNRDSEESFFSGERFRAYNARWPMPSDESDSPYNLYYSFDVVGVHIIALCPYQYFHDQSFQYRWLKMDLERVNRSKTPWVVVFLHAPWYNSNSAHQKEGESMRMAMEGLLYSAHVDVVFAGHVHAYERFGPVFNGVGNSCGPIHVTIGDGGNREGLANEYLQPTPQWSLFREASFGHGQFEVFNATHAKWAWHRNDNPAPVVADEVWFIRDEDRGHCVSK